MCVCVFFFGVFLWDFARILCNFCLLKGFFWVLQWVSFEDSLNRSHRFALLRHPGTVASERFLFGVLF